jgi:hypothetical protein
MSRVLLLLPLALLVATVTAALSTRSVSPGISQPIGFDHARHAKEDLSCLDCHKTAETSPHASLPRISSCLLCHSEPKGDSPEEAKLLEYVRRKEEVPWVQVNRMPGHVYFSHAVHVKLAEMDCAVCHGDMASASKPVSVPQVENLTMHRCMACHADKGASNDCLACHK